MSALAALTPPRAIRRAAFAFLLAAVACEGGGTPLTEPGPVPAPVVAQIEITASTAPLLVEGTRQLTARALSADGFTLHDRVIAWASSDTTVAGVTAQGVVYARAVGRAVISAAAGVARAEVAVEVAPVGVDSIAISRGTATLAAGETGAFAALLFAADGRLLFERPLAWSSSDTAIVVVNAQGRIRGMRPGTARIMVESEGRRAVATVAVTPGVLGAEPASWTLRVFDLVGAGVRCTVDGVTLRIAQRGHLVEGEVLHGASVACAPLPGATPPYVTPLPPAGRLEGTVDGRTVRLQATEHRWTLEGTLSADGRTLDGTAWVVDPPAASPWPTGISVLRTGRFVARR